MNIMSDDRDHALTLTLVLYWSEIAWRNAWIGLGIRTWLGLGQAWPPPQIASERI